MGYGKLGLCAALLLASGVAHAQDAPAPKSVRLVRVIAALPVGTPWLKMSGIFCIGTLFTETWTGARAPQDLPPYSAAFKKELESAGFTVVTGEDNLFDREAGEGDLQAAAVITDERVHGCVRNIQADRTIGDVRGDSTMKIDWQVYSPLQKQVVARITTNASATLENSVPGGVQRLISESFAANVRELASNADFRAAMTAHDASAKGSPAPDQQSKIGLAGSLKAPKRAIADAVGSVVTIFAGSSTGSGDLVSNDGYILTNAHVVGGEKKVRVRWSDGIETVADVVRVAKVRDVALIKTSPRDREPLAIKRGPVSPGQRVYAIGSPLGQQYQGTVSSGVISATRIMEGMRFIQSDVPVSHGSSGGALLDENGAMIAMTVSGDDRPEAHGLYFFIPIGDAMDFLNLEQQ